jgi:hypothetical protein
VILIFIIRRVTNAVVVHLKTVNVSTPERGQTMTEYKRMETDDRVPHEAKYVKTQEREATLINSIDRHLHRIADTEFSLGTQYRGVTLQHLRL